MKTSDGLKWLGMAFGSIVAVNIALPLLDAASSYIQSRINKAINVMAMDLEEHHSNEDEEYV